MSRAQAKARERARERAGYLHVAGWLPRPLALIVAALIRAHEDEVKQVDGKDE